MSKWLFSSESVTEGHPDKVCDQISDAVLDAILEQDNEARVACETMAATGLILVAGEISTSAYVDIQKIARDTIKDIGYVNEMESSFSGESCAVLVAIDEQSPDIAQGVDRFREAGTEELDAFGAGDQGIMFGYACDETEELMPMPISLSHKLARKLTEVRKNGTLPYLRPDGKTQVAVEYEDHEPKRLENIVVSTQHANDVELEQIREDIIREVIEPVVDSSMLDEDTKIFINPTGRFVKGGPAADTGLTGRKIIVDTYGGYASHGGGCFSGKDPTKVDRSASYAARYVAKNIVAAGIAKRCQIELSYAIGVAKPLSIFIDTEGTGVVDDRTLEEIVEEVFDLRPAAIIRDLDLFRPLYRRVAAYGHFGRDDLDLPWEKTDRIDELKAKVEARQ